MVRGVPPAQTQRISRLVTKAQFDWANINVSIYSQASLRLDSERKRWRKTKTEKHQRKGEWGERKMKKQKLYNRVNPKGKRINKLITELRIGYPLVNVNCFMI